MTIQHRNNTNTVSKISSLPIDGDHLEMDIFNISFISKYKYRKGQGNFLEDTHTHTYYEMHIITEGENHYHFGNQEVVVKAGDFLLVPPNVAHKVTNDNSDVSKYGFSFYVQQNENSTTEERQLISNLPRHRFAYGTSSEQMMSYLKMVMNEKNHLKWGYPRTIRVLCGLILIEMLRSIDIDGLLLAPSPIRSIQSERYAFAKRFITDNISYSINCKDVAAAVHMSVRQLDRIFIKECGLTIARFIESYRYKLAKQMLASGSEPVMKIAGELGFTNQYNFSRFFKRIGGVSPSMYRANSIKNNP